MKSCFPEDSIIGRYGGDEFVVYLKNLTGEMARTYMETFQRMISQLTLPTGEVVELSASAGGAAFPEQGEDVMSLCKSGQIQNCCHPNALMTLKEYLMDYASPETKAIGDRLIAKEVGNVPNEKARAVVLENLRLIEQNNRRDFRF